MADGFQFFLGTHQVCWLDRVDVPLFVSHRRLKIYKKLPRAGPGGYAIDSGGFTELSMYGRWTVTPDEYAEAVARYSREVGAPFWASPTDWMCEPQILAKTGLDVPLHQERTVSAFLALQDCWRQFSDAPSPFIPVLQGWQVEDYLACADLYASTGIDLTAYPALGLGSVCRRQATREISDIITTVHGALPGTKLHGFGVKTSGLLAYGHLLSSADSLAWSYRARKQTLKTGCGTRRSCNNCLHYALEWREGLIKRLEHPDDRRPASRRAAQRRPGFLDDAGDRAA